VLWSLLIGLTFLGTIRYGEYITTKCPQAGYSCPKICDVDHIHLPNKECKNAKSRETKVQLYKKGKESSKRVCEEDGEESNSQKEVLIGE
tara:strand:- start:902 stop:1171 length:270 start_codon:yes stop_codon:yes gene_type:complete